MNGGFLLATQAQVEETPWGPMAWVSRPSTTNAQQLTVIEVTLFPGGGHNFHKHPDQEEVIYVLAGRIEQWIEQDSTSLGPGDSAFIGAGVVHASFNTGSVPAKVLAILGPCVGQGGYELVDVAGEAPWKTLRS